MWATSAAYDAALAASGRRWACKVDVVYGAAYASTLDVVDGSVDIDDVAVRRSLDVSLADVTGTLTPAGAGDLLSPKGTELRPAKGLVLPSGTVEWVPLGVFGIEEPVIDSADGSTRISLKAFDRVAAVRARRFTTPWVVAEGTATTTAIVAIVTSRLTVPTRVVSTGHTTPAVVYEELSDPWGAVEDLAESDGLRAYFDPLGTLVVEPDVPVETGVVYTPGAASLLVAVNRRIAADRTYSGVIVKGEHPDHPPIRSELWDTDPTSPTYADGPFGRRPYGFTSSLLTSQLSADAAAATILARVSGMYEEVEVTTIGHPGHDVGDLVTVEHPASRTHGQFVVVRAGVPLRPGTNRIVLRRAP